MLNARAYIRFSMLTKSPRDFYVAGRVSAHTPIICIATDIKYALLREATHTLFVALNIVAGDTLLQSIGRTYEMGIRFFIVSNTAISEEDLRQNFPEAHFLCVDSPAHTLQKITLQCARACALPSVHMVGESSQATLLAQWLRILLRDDLWVVDAPRAYAVKGYENIGIGGAWTMHSREKDLWIMGYDDVACNDINDFFKDTKITDYTPKLFVLLHDITQAAHTNTYQKLLRQLRAEDRIVLLDKHALRDDLCQHTRAQIYFGGQEEQAHFRWHYDRDKNIFSFRYLGAEYTHITLPHTDKPTQKVRNLVSCLSILGSLNTPIPLTKLREKIALLWNVEARTIYTRTKNNHRVYYDMHLHERDKLGETIAHFIRHKKNKNSILFVTDFATDTPDKDYEKVHEYLYQLINKNIFSRVISIGDKFYKTYTTKNTRDKNMFQRSDDATQNNAYVSYQNVDDFLRAYPTFEMDADIFLRAGGAISLHALWDHFRINHFSNLWIDLRRVWDNLFFFRSQVATNTKIMLMMKASSYGTWIAEESDFLKYAHIDYMGVAYPMEGVRLRKAGVQQPIIVCCPDPENYSDVLRYKLEPIIFTLDSLRRLRAQMDAMGLACCPIHLKLDTGMHRLGGNIDDLMEIVQNIDTTRTRVLSIFTHLVGSEDPALDDFSKKQYEQFCDSAYKLSQVLGYAPMLHIVNTEGVLRHKNYVCDMIRFGIGLYGIDGRGEARAGQREVLRLTSRIVHLQTLAQGESIGYNGRTTLLRPSRVATLALGYADGFSRALGVARGSVLVHGKRVPILGQVCMDMLMIDVTDIAQVRVGDEVVVFGEDLSMREMTTSLATISYEIITQLTDRVGRIFVCD